MSVSFEGRAAIVTEIYLPQQYARSLEAQAALRDSLLPAQIKRHFERASERAVKRVLPKTLRARYDELKSQVIRTARCFSGYTTYDVSGTFREANHPVQYDASACIRIIDWPSAGALFRSRAHRPDDRLFQQVARSFLALRQEYETATREVVPATDARQVARIHARLTDWADQGTFLLYGFLLSHLLKLTRGREKAVLLTSHSAVVSQYETR